MSSETSAARLQWTSSRRILEALINHETDHPEGDDGDPGGGVQPPAKQQKQGSRRKKCPSPKQQLMERLDRLNLDMVVMESDGNCQVGMIIDQSIEKDPLHDSIFHTCCDTWHQTSVPGLKFRALRYATAPCRGRGEGYE